MWTLEDALPLIRLVEAIAPAAGFHVALTGGVLYKDGPRKDLDLMFYSIRLGQGNRQDLFKRLENYGFAYGKAHGWVQKATHLGRPIDMLFPDLGLDGIYDPPNVQAALEIPYDEPGYRR